MEPKNKMDCETFIVNENEIPPEHQRTEAQKFVFVTRLKQVKLEAQIRETAPVNNAREMFIRAMEGIASNARSSTTKLPAALAVFNTTASEIRDIRAIRQKYGEDDEVLTRVLDTAEHRLSEGAKLLHTLRLELATEKASAANFETQLNKLEEMLGIFVNDILREFNDVARKARETPQTWTSKRGRNGTRVLPEAPQKHQINTLMTGPSLFSLGKHTRDVRSEEIYQKKYQRGFE